MLLNGSYCLIKVIQLFPKRIGIIDTFPRFNCDEVSNRPFSQINIYSIRR